MFNIKKFLSGIRLVPKTTLESDQKGELEVDNTSGKVVYHNGTTRSPVVTEDHTATITNKSIDADTNTITNIETDNLKSGVLNTSTTLAGATDTQIPSALAVKTLVEDGLAAQNEASEITLVPVGTIVATNVQDAVAELDGDIQGHINDAVDAHDATAISYDGTVSGIVATEVQGAIDEVEARVEAVETSSGNTATDLSNHINDMVDAHDASAISNVPAGSIAATDVQAAINELDGDIQGHIGASSGVHGVTGDVVGTSDTQTLTNKTIQGASIETPVRSDVKQDTKGNLETYALTATNGQLVFATDTKEMFQVVDGLLVAVGGGAGGVGGVDILFVQTFETAALSDFTQTGLVLSDVDPLAGIVSAQLIHQAAINQSFKEVRAVDEKFRNRNITLKLNIKSAASAGNVTLTVVDETNAVTLVNSEQLPVSNDVGGAIGQVSFDMPDDCVSFSYEVIALPEAGSPVTIVDDVIAEITSLIDEQSVLVQEADSVLVARGNAGQAITANVTDIPFILESVKGSDINWNGSNFTVNKSGVYDLATYIQLNNGVSRRLVLYRDGASLYTVSTTSTSGDLAGSISLECEVGRTYSLRETAGGTLTNVPAHNIVITRQGSLRQVNPNPNSKITIPTSELRMEGASTRGSTATAIVRFDNIAKIRGDAFEVLSDATLGTRIVMKKKGRLNISSSLQVNTGTLAISKNQQGLTALPLITENIGAQSDATSSFLNVAGFTDVQVGDVIRVSTNAGLNASAVNQLNLSFQEQDISVSVTNTLPQFSESDSSVRVDTANGYGSESSNRVRRFSNIRQNIGSSVQYVDDPVTGAYYQILEDGLYSIGYSDSFSAATNFALTKNSATNVNPTTLPIGNILKIAATSTNNFNEDIFCSEYLVQGDIIRAMVNSAAAVGTENRSTFTISKVGKPNVTGVDVTPFVNIPMPNIAGLVNDGPIIVTNGTKSAAPIIDKVETSRSGEVVSFKYQYRQNATVGAAGSGDYFFTLANGRQFADSVVTYTGAINGGTPLSYAYGSGTITIDGTSHGQTVAIVPFSSTQFRIVLSNNGATILFVGSGAFPLSTANLGFQVEFTVPIKGLTATSDNIISPTESFSTDTASLTYAPSSLYTLPTLNTAPVGTFITFTYAANTNTRTQTTTAPTQTTSDMNVNGIQIFTRAYNASSVAGAPTVIAIQIGKGLKGKSLDLYKSTGKTIAGSIDFYKLGTFQEGLAFKDYNEVTGVLLVDAGYDSFTGNSACRFTFSDVTTQNNGYLVINASKSPALTGVPLLQPRIATIKDVKPNNTAGQGLTGGVFNTRVLNTLQDPTGIVSALGSNQITLSAGTYFIDATTHGFNIDRSQVRLRNITASSTVINGFTTNTTNSNSVPTSLSGEIVVTTESQFELQQYALTTSGNGGGIQSNSGEPEVYTTVKIMKIR